MIIIENGYNTSYIYSILIALYYVPSIIHSKMLDCDVSNTDFFYYQEIVKTNLIEPLRKKKTLLCNTINEIRNYSVICGWLNNLNTFFREQCAIKYYDFIASNLLSESLILNDETKMHYIEYNILDGCDTITIKNILSDVHLVNTPIVVPIYVNRTNSQIAKININKKIKFTGLKYRWIIHSIVCLCNSHYYAIIYNGKWKIFDDSVIPSVYDIDITTDSIKNKIMTECFLIFYRLAD